MAKTFILQPAVTDSGIEGEEIYDLTISQFLQLFENRYDYFYDEPFGSFDYEEMLQIPLKHCNIILGKKEKTTFGFKLSYSKEYRVYCVRILSPSTVEDWKCTLEFIRHFSQRFSCRITGDKGEEYSYDTIENFDFKVNILEGIKHLKDVFEKYNMEKVHLGTRDILTVDKNTIYGILKSHSPVLSFNEIARLNGRNLDLRPEQCFYITSSEENQSSIFGYYPVNFNEDFTLKVSPTIEPRNNSIVKEYGEISSWFIKFQDKNGEVTPPLDFYFVINNIPQEKIKYFGNDNMFVCGLNASEIKSISEQFIDKVRVIGENYKEIKIYDYYMWHYDRVLKKELHIGRLATVNHMAYFLKFCIEKNMMSDYFKKFYWFIKKYFNISENNFDLREIILYSMNGRVDSIILNEMGNRYAQLFFTRDNQEEPGIKYLNIFAEKYFEMLKITPESSKEAYLFTPYTEKYYELLKETMLEPLYNKIKSAQ